MVPYSFTFVESGLAPREVRPCPLSTLAQSLEPSYLLLSTGTMEPPNHFPKMLGLMRISSGSTLLKPWLILPISLTHETQNSVEITNGLSSEEATPELFPLGSKVFTQTMLLLPGPLQELSTPFKTSLLSILTSSTLPNRVVIHAPKLSKISQPKLITFSIQELLINRPSFLILLEILTLRSSMVILCSLLLIFLQWVFSMDKELSYVICLPLIASKRTHLEILRSMLVSKVLQYLIMMLQF